jgi:PPE-repeat protein
VSVAGLPPEVISLWMYTGPGSGPLLAAASAWQSLAADLGSSATSFQSVLSGLTGAWQGPSATQMTTAAQPYMDWITNTATQAQQASGGAAAAAAAFESAFGMTVPPPEIALNRSTLLALIATNFFGQNSPAIAATEAAYSEMWAQDVGMIQSYATAAQQALASLQSFTAAPQVANLASPASATNISSSLTQLPQVFSSALSQLTSGLDPTALSAAISPAATTAATTAAPNAIASLFGGTDPFAGLTSSDLVPVQAAYYMAMMGSMPARMFMSMGQSAANAGAASANFDGLLTNVGQLVDGKMQAIVGGVSGQLRNWGSAVSAQLAHAANIGGRMSVPQGWSAAATTMSRAAPILPATSVASPTISAPSMGMPGGPFGQALMGALSGRGLSNVAGVKVPKVVPRSPAAG